MTDGKTTGNDPAPAPSTGKIDRRDRIDLPLCADEPSSPGTRRYQRVIDQGYRLLNQQKEYEKKEKEHKEGQRRRKPKKPPQPTLYQKVRIEHLIGKYYQSQNMLGEAAEHFRRAAELALKIPDLALYAQLKHYGKPRMHQRRSQQTILSGIRGCQRRLERLAQTSIP